MHAGASVHHGEVKVKCARSYGGSTGPVVKAKTSTKLKISPLIHHLMLYLPISPLFAILMFNANFHFFCVFTAPNFGELFNENDPVNSLKKIATAKEKHARYVGLNVPLALWCDENDFQLFRFSLLIWFGSTHRN